jgi:alanine racemase
MAAAVYVRYVMTHLACADEPEHPLNRRQRELFDALRAFWPRAGTSIGNSAGLLLGDDFRCDLARAGIALLGGNPFLDRPSEFEPVVTVRARIVQIREISPGDTVGYGASFVASERMRIATVALGYADGYLRSLGNRGIAEVAGQRVPVVGRVSMDLVTLDVSSLDPGSVTRGDWATMIGGSVPLEELAALAGTINYELLTALGQRLQRVYLDGEVS